MPDRLVSRKLAPGLLFTITGTKNRVGWAPLPVDARRRALAIVQEVPFWFKPVWLENSAALEAKHRASFLLISENDNPATLVLPLPGATHRSWLESRGGVIGVAWEFDRNARVGKVPVAFIARRGKSETIVKESVGALRMELRSFRTREETPVPAFVDWFGWCTWDAFYHQVTARGLLSGLRKLARAGFAPGFVILDDGWQDTDRWLLRSTAANAKFPGGLGALVKASRKLGVRHFGVWHTLHGYWHGISPRGTIAKKRSVVAVPQTTTDFQGWPEFLNPSTRYALQADAVGNFYPNFYAELAEAGIDFTKVDNQAATAYFAHDSQPAAAAFETYQAAMQSAAVNHLRSGTIHCMANCSDILWRLRTPTVWRNSDDFYPAKPFAAQAKHLVNNAYAAIFTGAFATLDWDMFQSTHPHALFHAMARVLSGGPVFVSDKPGRHDFSLLRRLVLPDGRVPRFPSPGLPPARCFFSDPLQTPVPLIVINRRGPVGAIGLFNCQDGPTAGKIEATWSASDIPGLVGEEFVIHQPMNGELHRVERIDPQTDLLPSPGDCRLWTVAPVVGGLLAPLGLESYLGAAATIDGAECVAPKIIRVVVVHSGRYLAWCAIAPRVVRRNGVRVTFRYEKKTQLLRVDVAGAEGAVLTFEF